MGQQKNRPGCKDVFRAFLVEAADYDGFLEIPVIRSNIYEPKRLISFSKCISSKRYDCWVHFYEDDCAFERIWNNPKRYLPILKRFEGVITPDFSIYRDMPLVMQYWNVYRARAIGYWLQKNGVRVLPNIRFGDWRTLKCSCSGVSKHGAIAIGTHSCVKQPEERRYLQEGLNYVMKELSPKLLVIYGTAPDEIFEKYRNQGVKILVFPSEFACSRKKVRNGNR